MNLFPEIILKKTLLNKFNPQANFYAVKLFHSALILFIGTMALIAHSEKKLI